MTDTRIAIFRQDGHVRPLRDIEDEVILRAVAHYHGHMTVTAERLEIGRTTLYRRMDEIRAKVRRAAE